MYDYTLTIDGHVFTNGEISAPKLRKAVSSKGFPIGEVIIGTFTVGSPPGIPLSGGAHQSFSERATVQFGVNTGIEQLSLGTYFIAKRPKARSFAGSLNERLNLTCYDRLAYSNQDFDMEGDENTEVSYSEALNYIAQKMGCAVNAPYGLGGYFLKLDRDRTMRGVLGLIAGATGTNCMMSRQDVLTFVEPFSGGNYYGIPSEDRTEPYVGNAWQPLKVTFYNDKDSFSAGDGDFLHEIKLYNDAACQEMADSVYAKLAGRVYLPYKVKRAKVPVDFQLFDRTNVWEYTLGDVTSYSFVGNMSVDYCSDCAYATFSADDIDEVRDEFAFLTDRDKVKKDEKISGNKIGNRYGMKSVGISKGKDSVGAEAATTITEARFDNAEIIFKDKTDDGKPVDGGKMFMDTEKQSVNLEMKGLPTVAQDLHGALEELFAQGTSGGWVRPEEWIELPEPEDNQITIHVVIPHDMSKENYEYIYEPFAAFYTESGEYPTSGNVTVDWGDGTVEESNTGEPYSGEHIYKKGQYIITVTCTFNTPYYPNINSHCPYMTGIKIGKGFKYDKAGNIGYLYGLKEIYFRTEETDFSSSAWGGYFLNGLHSLEILELPPNIEKIGNGFLTNSQMPNGGKLYFPKLKSMRNNCFTYAYGAFSFSAPELTTIGDTCFEQAHGLNSLSVPSLVSAGYDFCNECEGLTTVDIPDTAVLGSGAFEDCNILMR